MTPTTLCNQIKIANNETLKLAYETCCEEYRKRLCEQWEIMPSDTSWDVPMMRGLLYIDLIGGIALDINQLIITVDNNVKLDDFIRYWDYCQKHEYAPSMKHWFIDNYRPKDYGKEI